MADNSSNHIKVSIIVLTYNQINYIDDALKSLVDQQAPFAYEIVVGDDCSTDGTIAKLDRWQSKHSSLIRLLKSEKNCGLLSNFIRTFNSCKGKYIAICEGDDYWTNRHKLQIQADFLDNNPSFSTCIHRVVNYYEHNNSKSLSNGRQKAVNTIVDLAKSNFITNVSAMFRATRVGCLPSWFGDVGTYDYALHMLNALDGDIYYMPKPMALYRKHQGAIWSRNSAAARLQLSMQVRQQLLTHIAPAGSDVFNALFEAYLACASALINLHNSNEQQREQIHEIVSRVQAFDPSLSEQAILARCQTTATDKPTPHKVIHRLLRALRSAISQLIPTPKPA